MALDFYQNDPEHAALYFSSPHWVYVPVAADRHLVTITGAVKLDFQGENSQNWRSEQLRVHLNFPNIIPPNKWYKIETCAPLFTLNAIDKGGDNHNGGWEVDSFWVDWGQGPLERMVKNMVTICSEIRVRGNLFSIFRIGYSLTVSGIFVDPPPIPPIE